MTSSCITSWLAKKYLINCHILLQYFELVFLQLQLVQILCKLIINWVNYEKRGPFYETPCTVGKLSAWAFKRCNYFYANVNNLCKNKHLGLVHRYSNHDFRRPTSEHWAKSTWCVITLKIRRPHGNARKHGPLLFSYRVQNKRVERTRCSPHDSCRYDANNNGPSFCTWAHIKRNELSNFVNVCGPSAMVHC